MAYDNDAGRMTHPGSQGRLLCGSDNRAEGVVWGREEVEIGE